MYPPLPPEPPLFLGPHKYLTGDREPIPEDEEDEEMLPEPRDLGQPPGWPSSKPCDDPAEQSSLMSAGTGRIMKNKLKPPN